MTTELKTLKDFEGIDKCSQCEQDPSFHKRLKQEAIKWVKYIRELGLDEMIWCEFFNLTEEDLK